MTERKKLSLTKPDQTDSDTPTSAYRKPPVRGAGTAPRIRMTAEQAAQAREDAASRELERERARAAWFAEAPAPASESRHQRVDRPQADNREPYQDRQAPQRSAPQSREPRREPAREPYRDQRSQRNDQRGDQRGGPRQEPRYEQQRYDNRQEPQQPHPAALRRDGRRDDGLANERTHRAVQPQNVANQRDEDGRIRLSKLMSESGLASRREADEWIEHGWVRVDGEVVSELGSRVFPNQVVTIDPAAHSQQAQRVTILINKPIGFVSGQAEDGYEPAVVLIRPENRWVDDKLPIQLTRGHLKHLAPAGRLDIDSTGMLVLTQDGRIAKHLIGEDSGVEKEYLVRVQSMAHPEAENVSAVVPPADMELLHYGLMLDGRQLKHAQVSWQNEQQLRFVLREGRKRQIRRMCEQVGLKVVGLKRVRMGSITLGKLPIGQWRFLRPDERF